MWTLRTRALLCCGLFFFNSYTAQAITVDDLQVDSVVESSATVGESVSATIPNSEGTLGGKRQITVVKTTAGNGVVRVATGAESETVRALDFGLGNHEGFATITWDGDSSPEALTANGLGSIDLAQDKGSAFRLPLLRFDYAFSRRALISLRLYDSQAVDGTKYSEVTIALDQMWDGKEPFMLSIPFASFVSVSDGLIPAPNNASFRTSTSFGPNGMVDLARVGAISLSIEGFGSDITLGALSTNGVCASVTEKSGAVVDSCGVCLRGPPGYEYEAHKVFDDCGLCPSDSQYEKAKDSCGVCFGDGSSCADCAGVPNGTTTIDRCGICGGDGMACIDCSGVPFGTKSIDACGVCGGGVIEASACPPTCVLVKADKKIRQYERRLVRKAGLLRARFLSEKARSERAQCGIRAESAQAAVSEAYRRIVSSSKAIFTTGVEVCGDSCVTVSYAEQVEALLPQFKTIEKEAVSLARRVQKCYVRRRIARTGGGTPGVVQTVGDVNRGLRTLIDECRKQKACPPR